MTTYSIDLDARIVVTNEGTRRQTTVEAAMKEGNMRELFNETMAAARGKTLRELTTFERTCLEIVRCRGGRTPTMTHAARAIREEARLARYMVDEDRRAAAKLRSMGMKDAAALASRDAREREEHLRDVLAACAAWDPPGGAP